MYPKVFTDFALAAGHLRPGLGAADARLFLRPAAKAKSCSPTSRRARRWSSCNQAMTATRRQGHGHGVLRAQRPAAPHQGAGPGAWRVRRSAVRRKAEPGNAAHVGAPMPGVISSRLRRGGPGGQGRRRAALHRGHEDGNGAARREGRHDRRGAGQAPATRSTPRICWSSTRPDPDLDRFRFSSKHVNVLPELL